MTHHPPGEDIQDMLDGRLVSARRAEIEAHVADCPRCRETLATLSWARQAAAQLPVQEPPPELMKRVALALDREARPAPRAARSLRRIGWVLVLGTAAAVVILFFVRPRPTDLPGAVAHTYAAYTSAALQLDTATGDGPALQAFFARHGISFATRVFNLDMMGYHLMGGRTHALGHRPGALFVYQDASGRALLCQMYEGTLAQLPAGGEAREHNGIGFRVYRSGNLTLVFWQEGAVVCVLAADTPTEEVLQLAYAKAVKV
jgi:anti-sigma factor RsiW